MFAYLPVRIARISALFALLVVLPSVAFAQTRWWAPASIGYAGGAIGLSYIANLPDRCSRTNFSDDCNYEFFMAPAVFVAGGATAGYLVGKLADRRLRRGEELSALHRNGIRAGTVLAGGTIGLIAAGLTINSTDFGNDELVVASMIGAGLIGGAGFQYLNEAKLRPNSQVGVSPEGRMKLQLSIAF